MSKRARISGQVMYREGDGTNLPIPHGFCEVEETTLDVTLSWTDGDTHGAAAIPIADYRRYLASKAIEILDPRTA